MAGTEGKNSNDEWEKNNVRPGEDKPPEVSTEEWEFGNRIHGISEKKWDENPQKAYDDAVVGDLDE